MRTYVYSTPSRLVGNSFGDLLTRRCELPEAVAADGPAVVAACSPAWASYRLYVHRRSGGEWKAAVAVEGSTRPSQGSASIAISGQTVLVAWTDRTNGGIYLARSTNGGASFRDPARLGTTSFRFRQGSAGWDLDGHVQVAVRGARAYVAWYASQKKVGNKTLPKGIRFRRSTDSGKSFKTARTLTEGRQFPGRIANPVSPAMVATSTGVLITHVTEGRQVRLLRSVDGGRTFRSSSLTDRESDDDRRGRYRGVWPRGPRRLAERHPRVPAAEQRRREDLGRSRGHRHIAPPGRGHQPQRRVL